MAAVGEVWQHLNYYMDGETGEMLTKHLLVLGVRKDGDVVHRLLTSQEYNRGHEDACEHGGDRPGFFLGILQPTGILNKPTWLDLRELEEDYDAMKFKQLAAQGQLSHIHTLTPAMLCPALACAAYAQDTTVAQKNVMMLARQGLNCS